jgi:RHS repeat-associated protein
LHEKDKFFENIISKRRLKAFKITKSSKKIVLGYYPFGLKHKGYNNVVSSNGNSVAQKIGFQEQMLDDDLGLNWYGFKYRNYDPSLARFHNIDPLAEDFNYQSPYNFAENRVIEAFELEGLEAIFIHGTWGDPSHMTSSQLKQIGDIFGNTSQIKVEWSGDNTSKARLSAAREVAQLALESNNGKEPITLVGHSHGGNVAIEAINILRGELNFEGEINLITLNTPNRQEFQLDDNANAKHFNIYAKGDLITRFGDLDADMWVPESLLGPSQTFDGAYNIMYEDQIPWSDSSGCGISNHCGTANSNFNTWLPLLQLGSRRVNFVEGLNNELLNEQYDWIKKYHESTGGPRIGSAGPAVSNPKNEEK